jgi:hypothetical protein
LEISSSSLHLFGNGLALKIRHGIRVRIGDDTLLVMEATIDYQRYWLFLSLQGILVCAIDLVSSSHWLFIGKGWEKVEGLGP